MRSLRLVFPFPVCLVLLLIGYPLAAADFLPITKEERDLVSVAGEPNAPAVVLFKKGEQLMSDYGFQTSADFSYLRVQARIKILTAEGAGKGEITIFHGDGARLQHFEGSSSTASRSFSTPPTVPSVSASSGPATKGLRPCCSIPRSRRKSSCRVLPSSRICGALKSSSA